MFTIRNKLHLGFGLILLFILGQFAVIYLFLKESQSLVDTAITRDFQASVEVAQIGTAAQKLRRFEKEYLIYVSSPTHRSKYFADWQGTHDEIHSTLARIVKNEDGRWSEEDLGKVREWQASLDTYAYGFTNVAQSVERGQITNTLAGNDAVRDAKDAFRVLLDGTAAKIARKYQHAAASAKAIETKFQLVNIVLIVVAVAGIVLVAAMLIRVPASIARPIESLTRAAHEMSTGNLGKSISISGSPEFKQLADTLERMRISQQVIMSRLRGSKAA